jgi:hypothetical protein
MAGYSLNVQPEEMLHWKYFVEDNICSLIINVQPELNTSRDLLPIALPSALLLQILMLCVCALWMLEDYYFAL